MSEGIPGRSPAQALASRQGSLGVGYAGLVKEQNNENREACWWMAADNSRAERTGARHTVSTDRQVDR